MGKAKIVAQIRRSAEELGQQKSRPRCQACLGVVAQHESPTLTLIPRSHSQHQHPSGLRLSARAPRTFSVPSRVAKREPKRHLLFGCTCLDLF